MKKLISRFLCIIMIIVFLVTVCNFSVFAETQYATGLIWDDWESYLEELDDDTVKILSKLRSGDINGDGRISAEDARIALRASVELEQLSENQKTAADIDKNLSITAADARTILRASVDLEKTDDLIITESKETGFVIGSLETAGSGKYTWKCFEGKNGFKMREYFINTDPEKDGAPIQQYFIFTPKKAGSYTLTFILSDINNIEVLDEFKVKVIINETAIEISENETYSFSGLMNAGSGLYNWSCTVSPDSGLSVQQSVKDNADNETEGTPVEQIFSFTGNKNGIYVVHFELKSVTEEEPIDEFYAEIVVK